VGFGFIAHGYAKIVNRPEHFIANPWLLGVPAPAFMGWVTTLTEIVGGAAVTEKTSVEGYSAAKRRT
jgi:putative oxidoreductase